MVEVDPSTLIICVCAFDSDDGFTIQCDNCLTWQHAVCIRIAPDQVPEEYLCDRCDPAAAHRRGVDKGRAQALQRERIEEEEQDEEREQSTKSRTAGRGAASGVLSLGRKRRAAKTTALARPRAKTLNSTSVTAAAAALARPQLGTFSLSGPSIAAATSTSPHQGPTALPPLQFNFPSSVAAAASPAPSNRGSYTPRPALAFASANAGLSLALSNFPAPPESLPPELGGGHDDSVYELWEYEYTPVEKNLWTDKRLLTRVNSFLAQASAGALESQSGGTKQAKSRAARAVAMASQGPEALLLAYCRDPIPISLDKLPSSGGVNLLVKPLPAEAFKLIPPIAPTYIPPAPKEPSAAATAAAAAANNNNSNSNNNNNGNASPYPAGPSSAPQCPFPRPVVYALFANTNAAITAGSFLSVLHGQVTSLEQYKEQKVNQYSTLGVPKAGVRFVQLGLAGQGGITLALDQRKWGDRGRFVRSGCHPNAIVRAVILPSAPAAAEGGKGKSRGRTTSAEAPEQHWAGQREAGPVASSLVFALFATRDIGRREEIVLPWDWDDQHIVHSLPHLLNPTASGPANSPLPPGLSASDLQLLALKMSNVTTTLLGLATCACAGSLPSSTFVGVVEGDCALYWMCKAASLALATCTSIALGTADKRSRGGARGNSKREPFTTLLLNALASSTTVDVVASKNKAAALSTGSKKSANSLLVKKKPNLGALIGLQREWRDDFIAQTAEERLLTRADEIEVKPKPQSEEAEDKVVEKEEAEQDVSMQVSTPLVSSPQAMARIDTPMEIDKGFESDESELTEPLSHLTSSEDDDGDDEDNKNDVPSSSAAKQPRLDKVLSKKYKREEDVPSESETEAAASSSPPPVPPPKAKKKKPQFQPHEIEILQAIKESKITKLAEEKRDYERSLPGYTEEKEKDKMRKRKKVIVSSSSAESSEGEEVKSPVRKKLDKPPAFKRLRSVTPPVVKPKPPTLMAMPPSPVLPPRLPTPPPPVLPVIIAPIVEVIPEPVREPTPPPPPPPPPRARISLAAYRERHAAAQLAAANAALLATAPPPAAAVTPSVVVPTTESTLPATLPSTPTEPLASPAVPAVSTPIPYMSPPRAPYRSLSSASASTPLFAPNYASISAAQVGGETDRVPLVPTLDIFKSIGDYFARDSALSTSTPPLPITRGSGGPSALGLRGSLGLADSRREDRVEQKVEEEVKIFSSSPPPPVYGLYKSPSPPPTSASSYTSYPNTFPAPAASSSSRNRYISPPPRSTTPERIPVPALRVETRNPSSSWATGNSNAGITILPPTAPKSHASPTGITILPALSPRPASLSLSATGTPGGGGGFGRSLHPSPGGGRVVNLPSGPRSMISPASSAISSTVNSATPYRSSGPPGGGVASGGNNSLVGSGGGRRWAGTNAVAGASTGVNSAAVADKGKRYDGVPRGPASMLPPPTPASSTANGGAISAQDSINPNGGGSGSAARDYSHHPSQQQHSQPASPFHSQAPGGGGGYNHNQAHRGGRGRGGGRGWAGHRGGRGGRGG